MTHPRSKQWFRVPYEQEYRAPGATALRVNSQNEYEQQTCWKRIILLELGVRLLSYAVPVLAGNQHQNTEK